MTSWYKQQLKDWVAGLDVKADKVLDIGGSQDPIKGRTRSWEVEKYVIADLPQPHQGVQADLPLDLNQRFNGRLPNADLIFCLEVFDYIIDPVTAFENLYRLLGKGTAWVSFPFVYPLHQPLEFEGLRYTEPAIRRLAERVGFTVAEVIYRRPDSPSLLRYYAEDRFRAAQGVDHNVIGYIVRLEK